jgi:fatty-acyl-CoA synthase
MACVVASGADGLTADDVTDFLGARVAKWWIPETVVLIDEIPKTGVGKYDKVELRRRFGSD